MGFRSPKPLVMFRPRGDMAVQKRPPTAATAPDGSPAAFPIRVADRMDVGYMIKYRLQFDDGAVRVGVEMLCQQTWGCILHVFMAYQHVLRRATCALPSHAMSLDVTAALPPQPSSAVPLEAQLSVPMNAMLDT